MDFLGHSSVTTTEVYARTSTKAKRKAIERVAATVIKGRRTTKRRGPTSSNGPRESCAPSIIRSCGEGDASYRAAPSVQLRKMWNCAFDRIVHHGRLVEFGGVSRRMEEALMLGKGGGNAIRQSA